jgi:hypothetical protein
LTAALPLSHRLNLLHWGQSSRLHLKHVFSCWPLLTTSITTILQPATIISQLDH